MHIKYIYIHIYIYVYIYLNMYIYIWIVYIYICIYIQTQSKFIYVIYTIGSGQPIGGRARRDLLPGSPYYDGLHGKSRFGCRACQRD